MPITLFLLVGLLTGVVVSGVGVTWQRRRRASRRPGAFRCALRARSGATPGVKVRWSAGRARWVRDTLFIERTGISSETLVLAVAAVAVPRAPLGASGLGGLGEAPVSVTLLLESGTTVEVAARAEDSGLLCGSLVLGAGAPVTG
jgi:hypothetical protein